MKYYSSRWLRAKLYAQLCGFVSESPSLKTPELNVKAGKPSESMIWDVNDENYDDLHITTYDIYSQEFFMYIYTKLLADRGNFFESTEGMTYIQHRFETRIHPKVIPLLYPDQIKEKERILKRWRVKVEAITTSLKLHEHDQVQQSYINVD